MIYGRSNGGRSSSGPSWVLALNPSPDRVPHVVAQVGEGRVGHPGPEVGAPAPHRRIDPDEQGVERLIRCDLPAQRLDLGHDGPQGLLGRVGVDVVPVGAWLSVALDVPAEEVQALLDMGDQSLSGDRRRPIVVRTSAISSRSASASALVP